MVSMLKAYKRSEVGEYIPPARDLHTAFNFPYVHFVTASTDLLQKGCGPSLEPKHCSRTTDTTIFICNQDFCL